VSAPPLPGIFASLAPVLDHWGYLAVAGLVMLEDFGVPVPGETILIAASVYAGAGRLNVVAVGVIGFLAAVAGEEPGHRRRDRYRQSAWRSLGEDPPGGGGQRLGVCLIAHPASRSF